MQLLTRIIEGIKYRTNMSYNAVPLFDTCIKLNMHVAKEQYAQAIGHIEAFARFAADNEIETEKAIIQFDPQTPQYDLIKEKLAALLPAIMNPAGVIRIDVARISEYQTLLQNALTLSESLTKKYAATAQTAIQGKVQDMIEKYPADSIISFVIPKQHFVDNAALEKEFSDFLKKRESKQQLSYKKTHANYDIKLSASLSAAALDSIKAELAEIFENLPETTKMIATLQKEEKTIKNSPALIIAGLTENHEALVTLLKDHCIAAQDVAPLFNAGLVVSVTHADKTQILHSLEEVQVFNRNTVAELLSLDTFTAYLQKLAPVLETSAAQEQLAQIPQLKLEAADQINRITTAATALTQETIPPGKAPEKTELHAAKAAKPVADETAPVIEATSQQSLFIEVVAAPTADTLRNLVREMNTNLYITAAKKTYLQALRYTLLAMAQKAVLTSWNEAHAIIRGVDQETSAYVRGELETFLSSATPAIKQNTLTKAKSEFVKNVAHFPGVSRNTVQAVTDAAGIKKDNRTVRLVLIVLASIIALGAIAIVLKPWELLTTWVDVPAEIQNNGDTNGQEPYKVWDSLGSDF